MDGSLPELSSDRGITGGSSEIKSPVGTAVSSMSTGWTDEKHSLYLNSIEATFVSQLYSSEQHSSGSSASSLMSNQFKVHRRGCWENLKFERAKRQVDIENQSCPLSENQWIRRFRSPTIGKEPHIISSNQVDDNESARKLIHLASLSHGREPASSKQLQACFSHVCRQNSVDSNTEVSDQNFVDKDFEKGKQSSRICYKKRARAAAANSPFTDQVVPSEKSLVEPTADEGHAHLKGEDAECSSRKPEGSTRFLYLESERSIFKAQDLNSEGLNSS